MSETQDSAARCMWCSGRGRYYISERHGWGEVEVVEDYVTCKKCRGTGRVAPDSPYAAKQAVEPVTPPETP